MVSAKVVEYIEKKLAHGVPKEKIVEKLKSIGLKDKQIEKAMSEAKQPAEQPAAVRAQNPAEAEAPSKAAETNAGAKTPVVSSNPMPGKQNRDSAFATRLIVLKKYVFAALDRDTDRTRLKYSIMKTGWSEQQVELLFQEYEKSQVKADVNKEREEIERNITEIKKDKGVTVLSEYTFKFMDISVRATIYKRKAKPGNYFHMTIPVISGTTDLILEEIRLKLIDKINLGALDIAEGNFDKLDRRVQNLLKGLVADSFPHVDEPTQKFLVSYLISKVLGLGIVEIIKADESLEEIVINQSDVPIIVYHKKFGWCKTNQYLKDDEQIIHLASMTGRRIGREISNLVPLLDAHLPNGDRVNATIKPITTQGPTITIRKFSSDPWTITKFLKTKTLDYHTAALIWLAIQFELSALVVGGTASGKTSALNVLTNLIPPDQRVISIEDTREIRLPRYMHWVPMVSRAPNPEGKGGIEMEDLLVNSLRMRPDRIIVGEVRKKRQAETLFEAIHTGHSCYATFHANNAEEAIVRLTNPPVDVPKTMMPAVSFMMVQFRNRRTGLRRTFQLAEVTKEGDSNVLYQYNAKKDILEKKNESQTFFQTLQLYTGNSMDDLNQMIENKIKVLKYLVKNNLTTIEQVGKVISLYYTDYDLLLNDIISKNRKIA